MELIIAGYAALLSSVLGFLQIADWRKKRKFIALSSRLLFHQDDWHWEITISNRGNYPVSLHYVAFGYYTRQFPKFWHRHAALRSIRSLIREGEWGDTYLEGEIIDGTILNPGETINGIIPSSVKTDAENMSQPWEKGEKQFCVWIEHSQGDDPQIHKLDLPNESDDM